ncbi:hypothetical protein BmR1_04g08831 [Babesia microti strain RI]|uniref:Uncharacterized protein n=1 Tax=Babesia microti (strain RI) TaxID=1133968 RepID=A0A1N6LY93_BABMR|nr:hypothetical protein BmR1_04g08831 [Babesia microti strain RI]SIO73843.1 hypothetical protein BmR1_04g08831 [Babesia microti strain RI]|eukprot:XP_021337898.1 hypothetical protein BmR1_04g08831 [Babesia microti strain RI]
MHIYSVLITLIINIQQLCLSAYIRDRSSNAVKTNIATIIGGKSSCDVINGKLNTYCSTFKPKPGNFGIHCNNAICKQSCCNHTLICSSSYRFPDKNFLYCVKERVSLDFNDCCQSTFKTPHFNYMYAGIAIAIMVSLCGVICALTIKDDKGHRKSILKTKDVPYLHIPQLIATDQNDIFWDEI